jgi:hypothetical protein
MKTKAFKPGIELKRRERRAPGLSSNAVLRRMKERDRVAEILSLSVSVSPSSATALLRGMDVHPCLKLFLRFA